ncbi:MAG: SEC-C metal-binding domain-containing protein [Pseudomonadota bacterium]
MRPFINYFKEIGEKETRSVTVIRQGGHGSLPSDKYTFIEHYCDDRDCDCRRVMISVLARKRNKILASINMGFDSDGEDAGPFLDPLNPQSAHSQELIDMFVDMINSDPAYLARLQNHYVMLKEKITGKKYAGEPFETAGEIRREANLPSLLPPDTSVAALSTPVERDHPKVGRNALCPCGSGKKYKKCCLLSSEEDSPGSVEKRPARAARVTTQTAAKAATEKLPSESGLKQAKVLVESMESQMDRETGRKISNSLAEAVIKDDPLIVESLLELLLDDYALEDIRHDPGRSYQACLWLIEMALTELRYAVDRNRPWAVEAADRIQKNMAARAFEVEVDTRVQTDLVRALYDAGLELHAEIKAKSKKLAEYYGRFTAKGGLPDLDRLFDKLASEGPNDAFALQENIMAELDLMPAEDQALTAAAMARTHNPLIRDVAVLLLLHPNPEVRGRIPSIFVDYISPERISPVSLRRMIGLRNWLPEAERPALDRFIKRVRAARVECAPMPRQPSPDAKSYASPIDGSGAQGLWNIVGKKRDHRMISVLLKQGMGIRDVMRLDGMDRYAVEELIRDMTRSAMSEKISPSYMHLVVPHFIRVGQEHSRVPNAGLLRVAEELGCEYWIPKRLSLEEEIASLEADIDPSLLSSGNVSRVLRLSFDWPGKKPFAASWFEDDARIDEILVKIPGFSPYSGEGKLKKATERIMKEVIPERYPVWAERVLLMALWARACKKRSPLPWEDFFIVARQLRQSTAPEETPLLRAVAERSVLSGIRRMESDPK